MLLYLIAAAILLSAGWILYRRVAAFVRSKGSSACANCPYAKSCSGGCSANRPHEREG